MYIDWSEKMNVGDLVKFDEDFYKSMTSAGMAINEIAIIMEVRDLFYCVQSGEVNDLWVTPPDIKRINRR